MALTDDDLERIELKIRKVFDEREAKLVKQHINDCPYGKFLNNSKAFVAGICCLAVILVSGVGVIVTKYIKW